MMVPTEEATDNVRSNLEPTVKRMRTGAKLEVLVGNGRSYQEVVHESSVEADLIFMEIASPEESEDFTAYYEKLRASMEDMPSTVFFLAAEPMDFKEILSD